MNPGAERNAAVGSGVFAVYPDLVLQSPQRRGKLQAVVEVETGESVNHLEALAEWGRFGRLRAAFHLYVPAGMVDVARRLCADSQIRVNEIWSYHTIGEQVRFTLVHRNRDALSSGTTRPRSRAARSSAPRRKKASARSAKPSSRSRKKKSTRAAKRR